MRNAECGMRNGEMRLRNAECGVRNGGGNILEGGQAIPHSAFRIPHFLLRAALLASLSACSRDHRTPLVIYSPHGRDLLTLFQLRFEALHPDIDVRWLDMEIGRASC